VEKGGRLWRDGAAFAKADLSHLFRLRPHRGRATLCPRGGAVGERASRGVFGFSLPRSAVRREVGALRRSRPTLFSKRCRASTTQSHSSNGTEAGDAGRGRGGGSPGPGLASGTSRPAATSGRAAAITPYLVFKALPRKHDPVSFLQWN
jgi:hypothetical protein